MPILPILIYKWNEIKSTPEGLGFVFLFLRNWQADAMEIKGSKIAKTTFEKEQSWRTNITWFQDLL